MYSRVYPAHPADFYQYFDMTLFIVDEGLDAVLNEIFKLDLASDHLSRLQLSCINISNYAHI